MSDNVKREDAHVPDRAMLPRRAEKVGVGPARVPRGRIVDASIYPDIVGSVPSSVFNAVHHAFAHVKWLAALGRSNPQLETILAPLTKKNSAWTVRDYMVTYQRIADLAARSDALKSAPSSAVTSSRGRPDRISPDRIAGAASPVDRPAQIRRLSSLVDQQARIGDTLARLRILPTSLAKQRDSAHLLTRLGILARLVREEAGSGKPPSTPARAREAAAASTVAVLLQRRMAQLRAVIATLAAARTGDRPGMKRSDVSERLRSGHALLRHVQQKGLSVGGRQTPLALIDPALSAQIDAIVAPRGRKPSGSPM